MHKYLISSVVAMSLLIVSSACLKLSRAPTEAWLGNHHVKVRPQCPGVTNRSHSRFHEDGTSKIVAYELECGETRISIRENTLSVNGKSYGTLNENDRITVDWGKVRVNSTIREEVR